MVLYIDVCVRGDSRTRELGEALLSRLDGDVVRVNIGEMKFDITDEAFLKQRDSLIAKRMFNDDCFKLARQFAEADTIVISAPYWD